MMSDKKIYKQKEIEKLESGQEYENCVFDKLELKGKKLQECIFKQCSFENCNLVDTKFNGTLFSGCNLTNANIAGCNFFSANFEKSKLMGLSFSRANSLIGITFTKCNFDFADLRGVDLSGQDLSDCSFNETDLSLANLEKTIFLNSHIANVKLNEAKLLLTDFRGAELQVFNLKKSNFKGAIFTPQQIAMLAEDIGIQVLETNN